MCHVSFFIYTEKSWVLVERSTYLYKYISIPTALVRMLCKHKSISTANRFDWLTYNCWTKWHWDRVFLFLGLSTVSVIPPWLHFHSCIVWKMDSRPDSGRNPQWYSLTPWKQYKNYPLPGIHIWVRRIEFFVSFVRQLSKINENIYIYDSEDYTHTFSECGAFQHMKNYRTVVLYR
jgi:hypothetical protein